MDIDKEWEQKKWQEIAMKVRNLGGDSYGVSKSYHLPSEGDTDI